MQSNLNMAAPVSMSDNDDTVWLSALKNVLFLRTFSFVRTTKITFYLHLQSITIASQLSPLFSAWIASGANKSNDGNIRTAPFTSQMRHAELNLQPTKLLVNIVIICANFENSGITKSNICFYASWIFLDVLFYPLILSVKCDNWFVQFYILQNCKLFSIFPSLCMAYCHVRLCMSVVGRAFVCL